MVKKLEANEISENYSCESFSMYHDFVCMVGESVSDAKSEDDFYGMVDNGGEI